MDKLLETFRSIGDLTQENEQLLLNSIRKIKCKPKTLLLQQGIICNKIYFVETGIARTFYYKNGKDITYWLALENDFVGSMSSFFMRHPSNKLVETVESCVLWEFEYLKLEKLFSTNQYFERIGRRFSNYGISLMENRFDNLHFNSAKERYRLLLTQQPEIIKRIPLNIIASYLGITQETLSRIRSKD